jgi:hypothetical protein
MTAGGRQSEKDSVGTSYGPIQALFKHLSGGTELRHRKTSVKIVTVMANI